MERLTVAISTVATSVLVAMFAQATEIYNKDDNKLDLYGEVNAKHYFSSNDADDGDTTYTRLGFKGETQINDRLTGSDQWKYEFKGNRAESQGPSKDKTRLVFVGLKFGDYGSVDYGRSYDVAYGIGAWTDVLSEFGGDARTQTDVSMTDRTTGAVTYRNSDFFGLVSGLNLATQYQSKNNHIDVTEANGDGLGFSIIYEYEGFGVGTTYAKSDRTNDRVICGSNSPNVFGQDAEVWAAGLKYDANNIHLATTHSETWNMTVFDSNHTANKVQDFEVVAQCQFDFGLRPSVAYPQPKGRDLGAWDDQDLVEYIDAGATYYSSKNTSTSVDYKISLIGKSSLAKASGAVTDDIVAIGLVYQF